MRLDIMINQIIKLLSLIPSFGIIVDQMLHINWSLFPECLPTPLLDNENHHNLEEAIQWLAEEQKEEELEGPEEEVEEEEEEEEEINIIEDSDNEVESREQKVSRELNLGILPKSTIQREVQKLNTYYNQTYTVNLTMSSDSGEPKTMKEALLGPENESYKEEIKKEISNFMSRGVGKPVSRKVVTEQMKRKLISTKWTFKMKTEQDNTIRHNARVVSRGFMHIPGVDYSESFAPVDSDTSISVIIAMLPYCHFRDKKSNWDLEMFDVEAAFLNADLDKQVFSEWP
jgi:Reverse transcriptase (RNA-dependent DNA polymerase)